MQIDCKRIKNILVVRNDRFGEFLLNIPAFRALKESFVNSKIIAAVDPYVRELAECLPCIDEIIEWGSQKHGLLERLRLIGLLKRKKVDLAIMLNPSKELNIITSLCNIPIRVGYNRKWGFLLTHKIEDRKYLGNKHEIEYNLELVSLIGAKTEDKTLSLTIDNYINNNLLNNFNIRDDSNFIILHPWTSDPIKQWPLENFRELAKKLIKELNIQILIVGGKENEDKSAELFNGIGKYKTFLTTETSQGRVLSPPTKLADEVSCNFNEQLINITGKTNLSQLAMLLKKSKLLISCDSGPVHLASCVRTPVIVIFRNNMPEKSALRWGPVSEGSIVIQKNNLSDINVREVFNEVNLKLNTLT